MVSFVVTVWVVTEVMLPCVKLGTTGTAVGGGSGTVTTGQFVTELLID